jgi:hypothetical protein
MKTNKAIYEEKETFIHILLLVLVCGVMMIVTGCSGLEVGGRLGVYRVDERQDSSRTYRQNVPLKCYFTSCGSTEQDEAQGS